MDDVLEYCGPESSHYANYITQPLINGCQDPSPAIRQAAAYGIGVAAHRGGAPWAQFLAGTIPFLFRAVQIPNARDDENVYATENVCAAIAKILHYNASAVQQIDEVVNQWVGTLPVTNDEEAAPYAYAYLAELIDKQHPSVLAQAQKVFVYVAQALESEALTGQTANRVIQSTKNLLQATNTDAAALLQSFAPEAQMTIRAYFS